MFSCICKYLFFTKTNFYRLLFPELPQSRDAVEIFSTNTHTTDSDNDVINDR